MKRITIGRASDNDIVYDVQSISNHHADVVVSNGRVTITDHSTNGTWINGKPLYRKVVHSTNTTDMYPFIYVGENLDMLFIESGYLYRPSDNLYRGLDYRQCYKHGNSIQIGKGDSG